MHSSPLHRTIAPAVLLLGTAVAVWATQPSRSPEYEVKAKVLRTLGSYVNWPPASRREGQPFVIGILGDSPFEHHLDTQARGKVVHNRKVQVVYLRTLHTESILACDLLYICESEYDRVVDILRICKGKPVLTVGDSPGFAGRGVIINLVVSTEKVGFEVNTRAAKESGLEINSIILASPSTRIFNEP